MNDTHREWTDRLSEYLTNDLEEADFHAVEDHLGECGPCRRVLEELRDVIARAGGLAAIEPTRDLWGGIAAAIQAPVQEFPVADAKVIALPTASASHPRSSERRREDRARIAFSLPQLAAASVALIAVSVATTWMAEPGLGVTSGEGATVQPAGAVALVSGEVPTAPQGLSAELSALEETLVAAFATLDPNTVRILERNLGVIERAIADSRQALAQDPGNQFLTDHLDQIYERKLTYLRDAARLMEWTD